MLSEATRRKHRKKSPFCKTCGHSVYDMKIHAQTEEHKRQMRKTGFVGRRVVGQCNTADFRYLEHLASVIQSGGEIDTSNLSNTQKMAIFVLRHFNENNVSFKVLLRIREVVVWDLNPGMGFEYKLLDPRDAETRAVLRSMTTGRRIP